MAYVIKVEYEGSLRRLLASRAEEEDLSLAKVAARVRDLFKLPSTAQLKMTYKDKDNDVVTLGNDEDLTDACVTQKINPLYIRATLVASEPAAENINIPPWPAAAAAPVEGESAQEPAKKECSTPEKPMKKTVKIVDPVFQGILGPNQVPRMMENIVKMVTTQMHAAKKVETNPRAACTPSQSAKADDPTNEAETQEKTMEAKSTVHPSNCNPTRKEEHEEKSSSSSSKTQEQSQGSNPQAAHKGVRCNICQMNPIVGPRFQALKKQDYDLCGRCYSKAGNENLYKRCEQPVTRPSCAGPTSVKLVRMSPAVTIGPAGMGVTPVLVFGPRGPRCSQVKTC